MAVAPKILAQSAPATGSNSTLYTVPVSTKAFLGVLLVHNPQTSAGLIDIWVYASGGSASDATKVFGSIPINPSETLKFNEFQGLSLAAGSEIVVKSTTAQVTYTLTGTELT